MAAGKMEARMGEQYRQFANRSLVSIVGRHCSLDLVSPVSVQVDRTFRLGEARNKGNPFSLRCRCRRRRRCKMREKEREREKNCFRAPETDASRPRNQAEKLERRDK